VLGSSAFARVCIDWFRYFVDEVGSAKKFSIFSKDWPAPRPAGGYPSQKFRSPAESNLDWEAVAHALITAPDNGNTLGATKVVFASSTRVVGAFPDDQSALNLAAARLHHIAGSAWSTKRYLNIELLKDQQMRGAITA
jgi:hypothetical protein